MYYHCRFCDFLGTSQWCNLGVLIAYLTMFADAHFGTEEEKEKGAKRLADNGVLVRQFIIETYHWWRDLAYAKKEKVENEQDVALGMDQGGKSEGVTVL